MKTMSQRVKENFWQVRFELRNDRLRELFTRSTEGIHGARAFSELHTMSLAISSSKEDASARPMLNVVLPELSSSGIFAGIRTALEFATSLAGRLKFDMRLISFGNSPKAKDKVVIRRYIRAEFAFSGAVAIGSAFDLPALRRSASDVWLLTHWTTAHSYDVAVRLGRIKPGRAIYLVQDYEPGFDPWGTTYALARTTYHAELDMVVNSEPLRQFLEEAEDIKINPRQVVRPAVDISRIRNAIDHGDSGTRDALKTVLFYARPSKPRNLFDIGVAALAISAEELTRRGQRVNFISAGEQHTRRYLAKDVFLTSLGKLPWQSYFDVLAQSSVVLSLQHSPHPSHPPLDAVVSGIFAVTNEMGGTRASLHRRLLVSEADPQLLAQNIVRAVEMSRQSARVLDTSILGLLGHELVDVVTCVAERYVEPAVAQPGSLAT